MKKGRSVGFVTCFVCGKTAADITLTKSQLREKLRKEVGWQNGARWHFMRLDHPDFARARSVPTRLDHVDRCPECAEKSVREAFELTEEYYKHNPES